MKNKISFLLFIILIQSCNQNNYPVGVFPEEAMNLSVVNSVLDDINSDIPTINHEIKLVFSSNRQGSQPNHFNLVESNLLFYWDKSEGFMTVDKGNTLFDTELRDWVRRTETSFNEKGPYSFVESENNRVLLFSRDNAEGIYSIYAEPEKANSNPNARTNQKFQIFEESATEMYPSFYGKNFLKGADITSQGKPEKLLFSSDKDGGFDIYELDIPSNVSVMNYLFDSKPKSPTKISINSSANDHMPFVYGDMLVFCIG